MLFDNECFVDFGSETLNCFSVAITHGDWIKARELGECTGFLMAIFGLDWEAKAVEWLLNH
jgi:hypothetical protein